MKSVFDKWTPNIVTSAALLFILPTLAININYFIAAGEGYVPWCVPYWDGCTSISATGRHGTGYYFFKATMIPIALLYLHYWLQCSARLERSGKHRQWIRYLGLLAVLALLMYVLALGAAGDSFRLIRRIGIIFFFCLTYLCQLLVIHRLDNPGVKRPGVLWQQRLCLLILGIGILTLFLDAFLSNYADYEYSFEWTIALLVHGNFLLAAHSWRQLDDRPPPEHISSARKQTEVG